MTKTIIHYWSDQSASISGEPEMRDDCGYPLSVPEAKRWCVEHGYDFYVLEAAGTFGSFISEKSDNATLPDGKVVETWDEYRKGNANLPGWVRGN